MWRFREKHFCMPTKKCSDLKVIAFGNVLVGYTAYLDDSKLLDRYKLSMNTKCELDVETFSEVTAEVVVNKEQHEPKIGGSAMKTVCILKYLGTNALFFGACGKDDQSEIIFELLKNANMDRYHFRLQTVPETSTGRRLSLVHRDSISSYTSTSASQKFKISYLQQVEKEENSSFLRPPNRKQIFYIEGFFVPKHEAVTTFIVNHYLNGRKYLALNLSAEYIVRLNFHHLLFLVNNALFVFGNRSEFETFRECWGAECLTELACGLAKDSKGPKILVITNGAGNIELISNFVWNKLSPGALTFHTFNVTPVENVADTTGCGDVFVAVFLHEWLNKSALSQCVQRASCLATKSIKNPFFSYRSSYNESNSTEEQHEPKIGGSAMKTVCILKYLGTNALFFGACGKDDQSEIIFELLKNANMDRYHFRLQTVPETSTGRRLSLVHRDSISSYTSTSASQKFKISYLQQVEKEENSSFLRPPNRKQIFYIEGFFVPKHEAVTTFIVNHYLNGRKYLALNLSAEYIVRLNFHHLLFLVNNALFVFGNRSEFETFRECWGAECLTELACGLAKDSKGPKILVITNGAGNIELISNFVWNKLSPGELTFHTFNVTPVENVADTTGCGDVFVAVFLHEWLNKSALSQCVQRASCLATKSIKNPFFSYRSSYNESNSTE